MKKGWRSANLSPDRRVFFGQGRGDVRSRALAARVTASFGSRGGASTADLLFPLLFPPTLISVTPNSGLTAGGDSIDLAGMNFRPGATVLFGATSATVVSVTPTHIIVTTPAHVAGAVSVTVTNPDLQFSSLANAFTFFGLIIPDDANTIFHFYVRNGLAKNLFGTLGEIGNVPRVASTLLGYPNGKSAEGAGPFSTAQYFTLPAGLLNFQDNYWITAIIKTPPVYGGGSIEMIIAGYSGTFGNPRTGLYVSTTFQGGVVYNDNLVFVFGTTGGISSPNTTPGIVGASTIFTLSFAQAGTSFFLKQNLTGATAPSAGATLMDPFTGVPRMGLGTGPEPSGGTASPFAGIVYEIRVTRTVPTAALLNALHTAIFN
jgi:hypothetical protein